MARALQLAQSGLAEVSSEDTLHVQGASFIVDELLGDSGDRDRTLQTLRALFRMIEEKSRLIQLLAQYIETSGLTVVIGSENFVLDLHPFSVVASPSATATEPAPSASSVRPACATSGPSRW